MKLGNIVSVIQSLVTTVAHFTCQAYHCFPEALVIRIQ